MLLACLFALAGCTAAPPAATPDRSPRSSSSGTSTVAAPLITKLPELCKTDDGSSPAEVAFVAEGKAWAAGADGSRLTCLFELRDPGAFEWGPRADRVAVGGLAVQSSSGRILRPGGDVRPASFSWGRPKGLSIVFVDDRDPKHLKKLSVKGRGVAADITPVSGVTYRSVAYHPSGLAIAFVTAGKKGDSIWLSSNSGAKPKRLIVSKAGTRFGAIAFQTDGDMLYGAQLADGTSMVARYVSTSGKAEEKLWVDSRPIIRFAPGVAGPGAAFDVGTGCADRVATFSTLDGKAGMPLLPRSTTPTTVIGRVAPERFLVAAGSCDGPLDLWVAGTGGEASLLVSGVDRAAIRIPEPEPPPSLPEQGFGTPVY